MHERFKRFLKETFRAHTKEEYKEFFTRGLNGKDTANKVYPWVYVRAFALCIILFAAITFLAVFTGNDIGYPTVIFLGGAFINVPFLVLLYELYPGRGFSFAAALLVLAVGTVAADVIIELGYFAFSPENDWWGTLWTGFLEEFGKAVPAIIAILIFKKRDPLFGFLIGAAVGAGVSIVEDMGYIYSYSSGFFWDSYNEAVGVAVGRGLTSVCTHTLWTALIGWAFLKFRKPFKNFRFWGVCLLSVALHFCWDMPLEGDWPILVCLVCAAIVLVICARVIKKERIAVLLPEKEYATVGTAVTIMSETAATETAVTETAAPQSLRVKYCTAANLIAAISGVILAVFALIACYTDWGWGHPVRYFSSAEEFIDYVQCGLQFNVNLEREYDDGVLPENNYAYGYENGKLVSAVQKVEEEGYNLYYYYKFTEVETDEAEKTENTAVFNGVRLEYNGVSYPLVYDYTGSELITYYEINPDMWHGGYDDDTNRYYAYLDDYTYVGLYETIALGSSAGVVLIAGAAAYITLKIKARRYKNA